VSQVGYLRSVFLDNAGGVVGRAVVNDQNFKIRKVFAEHAFDRLVKELRSIVGRRDDG
jgi:hypothetical protein